MYGKDRNNKQRYKCVTCKKHFVETKNTPFCRKRFRKDEVILICKLLVERNSIRSIERITEHHRDTIGRLINGLVKHVKQINSFLLKDVKLTQLQLDEFWSYIKKAKETYRRRPGGCWRLLHSIES